jgi:DNA-binding response OmpR family regulator
MNETVLLVDDELHIVRAAEFKLKKAGYRVLCAEDGEAAWHLIERERPDLVITDLQMPRLSGTELIHRIRQTASTAHLPVIMLTARSFELVPAEAARRWDVSEILSKPFSPRELCERVQAVLEQVGERRASAALVERG